MRRSAQHRLFLDQNDKPLGAFQAVLLTTDGTVTDLLALYTGEQINVLKIDQSIDRGAHPEVLACSPDAPILRRRILLRGDTRNYLYAESLFVFDRLSPSTQHHLLHTDVPIGLIWKQERLETYREIVFRGTEVCGSIAKYFDVAPEVVFLSRTYVIHHAGKPLGIITEKFPNTYFVDRA